MLIDSDKEVAIEKITPAIAREWLERNIVNRPLHDDRVSKLATAMRSGRWRLTHQGIAFDRNGDLVDGQHRLSAVIKSEATIECLVFRGFDRRQIFSVIDTGKKRSHSDALSVEGFANSKRRAAAIREIMRLERGSRYPYTKASVDNDQMVELAKKYDLTSSLDLVFKHGADKVIQPATIMAIHHLASQFDKDLADAFVVRIGTGEGLTKRDPEWHVRDIAIRSRRSRRGEDRLYLTAICIKAFNARSAQRSVGLLRWANNEVFPTLKFITDNIVHEAANGKAG